jgi:hypothetical protein
MSTAFHPQTDSQTKRVNQTIETFLQSFVNILQNHWIKQIASPKFAYNNSITSTHMITSLYANYGYYPSAGTAPIEINILVVSSVAYGQ